MTEQSNPNQHNQVNISGLIQNSVEAHAPALDQILPDAVKAAKDLMDTVDDRYQREAAQRFELQAKNLKLDKQVSTDSVTGLMSREYWMNTLNYVVDNYQEGDQIMVSMGDGDGFKVTNDTRGHAAGNRLLGFFARAFQTVHNRSDVQISRLSGDEFAVLMRKTGSEIEEEESALANLKATNPSFVDRRPEDPLEQARHFEDRVNEELQILLASDEGAEFKGLPVSISIGSALYIHGEDTADSVLARAEHEMYIKKYQGKSELMTADDKGRISSIMPILLDLELRGIIRVDPILKNTVRDLGSPPDATTEQQV